MHERNAGWVVWSLVLGLFVVTTWGCATAGSYAKKAQEAAAAGDDILAVKNAETSLRMDSENLEARQTMAQSLGRLIRRSLKTAEHASPEAAASEAAKANQYCGKAKHWRIGVDDCADVPSVVKKTKHAYAQDLEAQGDKAFAGRNFQQAVDFYRRALEQEDRSELRTKLDQAQNSENQRQAEKLFKEACDKLAEGDLLTSYKLLERCKSVRKEYRTTEVAALERHMLQLGGRTYTVRAGQGGSGYSQQLVNEVVGQLDLEPQFFRRDDQSPDIQVVVSVGDFRQDPPSRNSEPKTAWMVSYGWSGGRYCVRSTPASYTVTSESGAVLMDGTFEVISAGRTIAQDNVSASDSDRIEYAVMHSGVSPKNLVMANPLMATAQRCFDNAGQMALAGIVANAEPCPDIPKFGARKRLSLAGPGDLVRQLAGQIASRVKETLEGLRVDTEGLSCEDLLAGGGEVRPRLQLTEVAPQEAQPVPAQPIAEQSPDVPEPQMPAPAPAPPTQTFDCVVEVAESGYVDVRCKDVFEEGDMVSFYRHAWDKTPCAVGRISGGAGGLFHVTVDMERSRCRPWRGMKVRVNPGY